MLLAGVPIVMASKGNRGNDGCRICPAHSDSRLKFGGERRFAPTNPLSLPLFSVGYVGCGFASRHGFQKLFEVQDQAQVERLICGREFGA
jgi:hypothetical protein